MQRYLLISITSFLFLASHVLADRPGIIGGGSRPNLGDRIDQDRWEDGSILTYEPGVAVIDPDMAEKLLEKKQVEEEAARQKAIQSHSDPQGGFFNSEQSPKDMFDN